MNKLLFLLWGVIGIILFGSCEQETDQKTDFVSQKELKISNFKYHGVLYSGEINDTLKEKFANLPELAMLIDENGNIEYFDNFEELLKKESENDMYSPTDIATRASRAVTTATVDFYKDAKYKGGKLNYSISSTGTRYVHQSDLASAGFSQNISSVRVSIQNPGNPEKTARCAVWDGVNFKGNSVVFNVPVRNGDWLTPDLRTMPRGVSGANWGDAIRSCKLDFQGFPPIIDPWQPN